MTGAENHTSIALTILYIITFCTNDPLLSEYIRRHISVNKGKCVSYSSEQRAVGSAVYTRTKSRKAGIASAAEGDVNEVRMMEKENFRDEDLCYKCLQRYR